MTNNELKLAAIRAAFREFYKTLGCGCCSDYDGKKVAEEKIAILLDFKPYSDGSGYAFYDEDTK